MLGPLCALGSSVTWAFAASVYAQQAERVGPLQTNLVRALLVIPLYVVCSLVVCGPAAFLALTPGQLGWLGLSTVCSYGLGDLVFYLAAMRLGTPTALAIASIYPVWAAVGGALTLGEKVGPLRIAGTLACIGGVVWLVLQQGQGAPRTGQARRRGHYLGGVALALLTSFFWGGNTYTIRRGAAGVHFLVACTVRFGGAIVILALARRFLDKSRARPEPIPRRFVITSLVEAFGGSSIFVYGLSHSELSVAATLSSLAPLFAVPIGLLLGTEKLSVQRVTAITLTVAGVALLVR